MDVATHRMSALGQPLVDGAAGAATLGAILDAEEMFVVLRQFLQAFAVQRLDETHVHQAGVVLLGQLSRGVDQGAEIEDGHAAALAQQPRAAQRQGFFGLDALRSRAVVARVAHQGRARVGVAGVQQQLQFTVVRRGHDDHLRNAATVGDIEVAGMGRAVGADHAAPVHGEQHIQLLDGHIVDELVVAALQKGGVDGDDGLEPVDGHARGQRNRVLFGNGDIVKALGEGVGESHQSGAFAHCRGDRLQQRLLPGLGDDPVGEGLGVALPVRLPAAGAGLTRVDVEGAGTVELAGIVFGRFVALALLRDDVQQTRTGLLLQVGEDFQQGRQVVAVDGAVVGEAQFLEQGAGHDHALDVLLGAPRQFPGAGNGTQHLLAAGAHLLVEAAGPDARQVLGQGADIGRDRHLVVVEDHQQVHILEAAGMVHGLEGHAGGHAAVADDGHRMAVDALGASGQRHAQGRADGSAGVTNAETVVFGFGGLGKARKTLPLTQRRHGVAPTGEHLVWVALVADIPHQTVVGRIEQVVQGDGQFHRAQARGQMSAGPGYGLDHGLAQFLGQLREFLGREQPQVVGVADAVEQGRGRIGHVNGCGARTSARCRAGCPHRGRNPAVPRGPAGAAAGPFRAIPRGR